MPPPVLTLTANPLAEVTYQIAGQPRPGATQRATAESFQVGGKGFNVAKMLARLGHPVTALSFAGGPNGQRCRDWLTREARFPWELIESACETRTGAVIRDAAGGETTVLGADCHWDEPALDEMAARLREISPDAVVALCGSFPGWADDANHNLRSVLRDLAGRGRLVLDTYGPALEELIRTPVELVKINRDEWILARGSDAADVTRSLPVACIALPVKRWIVTDGAGPTHYATQAGLQGCFEPQSALAVSSTGSGDVFLATVLAGEWRAESQWPTLLARAAQYATANAAHLAIAEFAFPP